MTFMAKHSLWQSEVAALRLCTDVFERLLSAQIRGGFCFLFLLKPQGMLEHAKTFEQELVCEQITCNKPQVVTQGQILCELLQNIVISLQIQSRKGGLCNDL